MPGFDRTGPFGAGPMTGGARGYCNPTAAGSRYPFFGGARFGRGQGLRRGFRAGIRGGFGRGYGWDPPESADPYHYAMDASSELDMLKAQADSFKSTLDAINRRMAELEKSSE